MTPEWFQTGYTSGSAQQLLQAALEQRFTGTIAFYTAGSWLFALVVGGESEQFARLGEYPGVRERRQYVTQFPHEARLSAELPAQAGWPLLPVTASWPTALVPWPIVQRGLRDFTGFLFLTDAAGTACVIERGKVILVRTNAGAAPTTVFPRAYELASEVRLAPLPLEFLPALHTATPPAEFYRGSSVVLTVSNPAPLPVATPRVDAAELPQEPAEPAAEPVPNPLPELFKTYRLTLRGADALDPMNDRSAEFRAEFSVETFDVLRAIRAQRTPDATPELLSKLVDAGYIYHPEESQ